MSLLHKPWGVATYGAGSVKAVPDLIRIAFKISRLEQSPSEAFAASTAAVQAVRQAARDHGVPDSAVERSHLKLRTHWTYGGDSPTFAGYQCEAAFAVQSSDLDDFQPLLVDLVAAGADEITDVDFDVSNKAELRAEARRLAVTSAREKAELYASAAGIRLGTVLHIDDVDPERDNVGSYRGHGMASASASEDLAPGHVVVAAAVIMGFGIVPTG